ncbi:hypothetical protein INR49_026092 [Caranx melampygus]|nr:hypothetical protein INR49_026092 [Caranx melampygus]
MTSGLKSTDQGATPVVCVTEGEEADAEDSDANNKCSGDTSAGESGCEGAGTAGEQEGGEGEEEVVEDAVEDFKPEEEDEEDGNKKENGALLHQHTRTSLESLPGSLEEINMNSQPNPVSSIEVPKKAAAVCTGGCATQKRSRSPARVKRRKPKESDTPNMKKKCTRVCVDKQNGVLVAEIGQDQTQEILLCYAKLRTLEEKKNHPCIFRACTAIGRGFDSFLSQSILKCNIHMNDFRTLRDTPEKRLVLWLSVLGGGLWSPRS